jgi:hypothetical protein
MNKGIFNRQELSSQSHFKICAAVFISLGILIRLFHYFYNRSLWMDEVYLSSSLIHMNYYELLTQQLEYQQKAPLGFLLAIKTFTIALGNTETALRLFSLISGILSLFLFIPVAKYFTTKTGVIIGLGIIAFSPALIFHSVEIKQYQAEMLATLLVFYSYIKYNGSNSYAEAIIWGSIGAVIIWFSYSSVFVLFGISATIIIGRFFTKDHKFILVELIPSLIWLISFLLNFMLFTHKHAESKWIVYWFDYYKTFMPFPPNSIADLKWFPFTIYHLLDYPLGLTWRFYELDIAFMNLRALSAALPLLMLFLGLYASFKNKFLLLLCSPFVLVFMASGLKLYPLTERFWVFISPIVIILIAKGYVWLTTALQQKIIGWIVLTLLLIGPFLNSAVYMVHPEEFLYHKRSFQREALEYINRNFQSGDIVYVYWNDLPGFKLYEGISNLKFSAVKGLDHRYSSINYTNYLNKLKSDFRVFNGKKRIWLIYNDYYRTDIGDRIDEPKWYYLKDQAPIERTIKYLSVFGDQKEVFKSFDVRINLITRKTQ